MSPYAKCDECKGLRPLAVHASNDKNLCLASLRQAGVDDEAKRWGDRLGWVHRENGVDGSGTESGDSLDVIESEVRQALDKKDEARDALNEEAGRLRRAAEAMIKDRATRSACHPQCDCVYCNASWVLDDTTAGKPTQQDLLQAWLVEHMKRAERVTKAWDLYCKAIDLKSEAATMEAELAIREAHASIETHRAERP